MNIQPEIAFHHVEGSPAVEAEIRKRIAKLERIFDRMTTCRVRVERRAKTSTEGRPPVVRIEMSIPGHKDLIVSHEPEHLMLKYQAPDIDNAIHEAFGIAERQLASLKEQMKDHTAVLRHESVHEFAGQVAEVTPDEDFGFLLTKEGGLLYFHRNSVLSGDFERLKRGDAVSYVEEAGDTGPIASKVRVRQSAGA